MTKFYRILFAAAFLLTGSLAVNAQDGSWSKHSEAMKVAATDKAVARTSFPKDFRLFDLNIAHLRQRLFSVNGSAASPTTTISLPNADGKLELFEVNEASNFEPALQAQFPEIRAYSGKGITDPTATLKLSISPKGVQTMVFRSGTAAEFIEPFSADHTVYAVFRSKREKGNLPWSCSTQDQQTFSDIGKGIYESNSTESNTGQLKTMRLAQSCTGEYANYFGATSSAQEALVLAAFNNTISRCNGVFEKDLAIHLNLIPTTTAVIFYNPATDPYSTAPNIGPWNAQLQATLTANIGAANYDIGHLFGASGGGGNAGCIGCVCDAAKGSGITSPADAIPQGDNFDIDYVAHEMGHQMGGLHTFSFDVQQLGAASIEVGSGISVMAYAGIVSGANVAAHSLDYFHAFSINQIQVNMGPKTCPVTTAITPNNATPVVSALTNYTIPITTPFALTGTATDANAGDVLSYVWEQYDAATAASTGINSLASPTKLTGPNFADFPVQSVGTRLFPRLQSILTGASTTSGSINAGDNVAIEALSSVGRDLNFRLTVRDNSPYVATGPNIKVGQTAFGNMTVTVSPLVGPFLITSQNSAVSYAGGSTQTITWSVNGTTGAPTNTANVRISWSSDGGTTFTPLIATTANDGTESVTIPVGATTTGRIRVEAIGNIYFDINNANITVVVPPNGFTFNTVAPVTVACGATTGTATIGTAVTGTFTTPIQLTSGGNPAGTTVTFAPNPLAPGSSTVLTLGNIGSLAPGTYTVIVTGTATGAATQTVNVTFNISAGASIDAAGQPTPQAVCNGTAATFTVNATGSNLTYQWQVSTTGIGGPYTNVGTNSSTYTTGPTTPAQNGNYYHVIVSSTCGTPVTSNNVLLTVNTVATITTQPVSTSACVPGTATFTAAATGTGISYQWQVSTDGGANFVNIPGAVNATYTTPATTLAMNNYRYRVLVSSTCSPGNPITSNVATLTVNNPVSITAQPEGRRGCAGDNYTFTVGAAGSTVTYQWQISTNGGATYTNIQGATGPTYTVTNAPVSLNGAMYRVIVSGVPCGQVTSNPAMLTVGLRPSLVLTVSPSSSVNPSINTMIQSTVSPPGNYVYSWTLNGQIIPNTLGATSIPVTVDNFGTYGLTVTDVASGCSVTSNIVRTDSVPSSRLFIYPNPVTSTMQVRFYNPNATTSRNTMIMVYDARGARVFSGNYTVTGTYGRMDVDLSRMQEGIYHVELREAGGKVLASEKVLKR